MNSTLPVPPPPANAPRTVVRANILAWIALACGGCGLCLIAIPMQILAASQPNDVKLADEIKDLAREVVGKPRLNARPAPAIQAWMPLLNAAGMALATAGVVVGILAWAKREDWRAAAGGVALGIIGMMIHYYLIALGLVLLVAILYFASTFAG